MPRTWGPGHHQTPHLALSFGATLPQMNTLACWATGPETSQRKPTATRGLGRLVWRRGWWPSSGPQAHAHEGTRFIEHGQEAWVRRRSASVLLVGGV